MIEILVHSERRYESVIMGRYQFPGKQTISPVYFHSDKPLELFTKIDIEASERTYHGVLIVSVIETVYKGLPDCYEDKDQ